jgi:nucleoside-diphosphate-sugar epimerase
MTSRLVSITGATGFVGWHLAEAFRDAGWRVRAVIRPGSSKTLPAGVEAVRAPLECEPLTRAFDGSSVVVHAAGLVRAPRAAMFDAVNVGGTREAVEAANAVSARLILVSSQAAAGPGTRDRPTTEVDVPRPMNAYGRSKLAGEALVRSAARVPWTIIRPPAVYGPRDRGFLPLFRLASRGFSLLVTDPDAAFTLVYVRDLARGIVLAATDARATGETFFIGHPVPRALADVLASMSGMFGRPFQPWRVPAALLHALGWAGEIAWMFNVEPVVDAMRVRQFRAEGFVCSVERVRDVLGFTASTDWEEGADETARWYQEQGWL